MKRKIYLYICILSLMLFCLCGCEKKKAQKEAYVKEFEALTEIKEGQPNVYLITKALNNNYWTSITENVADAGNQQGVNIYYSGSEVEAEWETQVALLEQALERGADAIIIAPDDSSKLAEPIYKAYETGIPVVLIDTTITAECYDICFMTDNLLAGQQAAQEMIAQLQNLGYDENTTLDVAIQIGSGSSQTISERLAGFSQYWADNAYDNWNIVQDVKVNNGDMQLAYENTIDLMKTYPNLKGVFGCNNGSTVGLARGIYENNRTDIVVVGFDFSDEMATLICDPEYPAATMLQRQYQMAEKSVEAVRMLLQGEKIEQKFMDTGVVIVNQDNIYSDEIQEIISN